MPNDVVQLSKRSQDSSDANDSKIFSKRLDERAKAPVALTELEELWKAKKPMLLGGVVDKYAVNKTLEVRNTCMRT